MNKKDTVLILYPPGGYGTFIEWALNYYSGETVINDPIVTDTGSCHKFWGNPLDFPVVVHGHESLTSDQYFSSKLNYKFARAHAVNSTVNFQEYVDKINPYVKQIVYLEPSISTQLLLLHNVFDKTKNGSKIKESTIKNKNDNDPIWKTRENISFWFSGHQHYVRDWVAVSNSDFLSVPISVFVAQPKQTLERLFSELDIPIDSSRWNRVDQMIDRWKNYQKNLQLDSLCSTIIDATVSGKNFNWNRSDLTLHCEAFVQWALRDLHKLELKCYNLDVFPDSTQELRKHLINE